jgi:hypothetical protein
VQIDSNGDGTFERTITADATLTADEFTLQTGTVLDFNVQGAPSNPTFPGNDQRRVAVVGIHSLPNIWLTSELWPSPTSRHR